MTLTSVSESRKKLEMRLFILYNLRLEIINFLYKNFRKSASYRQPSLSD